MCMCGDYYCFSCGPAQGNSRCYFCGAWSADGGCKNPAACEIEANGMENSWADDIQWERDNAEEIAKTIRSI